MNIDLLMNGQAEAVSLSEQGMTVTEYLYSFTSSEDAPATMMVNTANGDLIRESLESAPVELSQNDVSATDKPQMRITINDMLTDDDVLLFRAKPATQGVGIGDALQRLLDSQMQMGVSAEFLGERGCLNSTAREVESRYRDGDWFESCKSDDHDD